jgi:hypothetical protein
MKKIQISDKASKTAKPPTKEQRVQSKIRQDQPTIFPIGFGIRRVAKEALIIDFIDGDEPPKIVSSIAILREQAASLAEGLVEAFHEEDD